MGRSATKTYAFDNCERASGIVSHRGARTISRVYCLRTNIALSDAFVVAMRSAFEQAGVALEIPSGPLPAGAREVRLEMQPDHTTVLVSLPLGDTPQEFVEENPDMVEIAVRDSLRRYMKRMT
jgi:hypothetical protein